MAQAVDQQGGPSGTTREGGVPVRQSLNDYDHVTVTDIGGNDPTGYWLVVHDHRVDLNYRIAAQTDFWNFVGALVDHRQCLSLRALKEVA